MNCKPGDLAIVVSSKPHYNGRIVEVLFAPPAQRFTLPDGYPAHGASTEPAWVLKFVGGPVNAPLASGNLRKAWYGVGADRCLRPLRDDPDAVERERETAETL